MASENGQARQTRMHTVSFRAFDVVRVPFPFTDRNTVKNRPALVISRTGTFNTPAEHSIMAMTTSSSNPPWPMDCILQDLQSAGLPAPSKVRFKLFTLDHRLVRGVLGHLALMDQKVVCEALNKVFAQEPCNE